MIRSSDLLGELPISFPLQFTLYLGKETEEIVWHVLLANLKRLHYFYRETNGTKGKQDSKAFPEFEGLRVKKHLQNIYLS